MSDKPPRINANLKWLVATLLSAAGTGGGALWLTAPGAEAKAAAAVATDRAEKAEAKLELAHEGRHDTLDGHVRSILAEQAAMRSEQTTIRSEQSRQGRLLNRIAAKILHAVPEEEE